MTLLNLQNNISVQPREKNVAVVFNTGNNVLQIFECIPLCISLSLVVDVDLIHYKTTSTCIYVNSTVTTERENGDGSMEA